MAETWDGKPRRRNDMFMMALESKVDSIYAFLQREFGNTKDDGFGSTEGDTKRALRELNEKVQKQNGRVSKSETEIQSLKNWRMYILGGSAMFCFMAGLIVALLAIHK